MKRVIIFSLFILAFLAFASKKKITGRWETKPSEKGNITGVIFNRDNTHEVYVNKKPLVSGTYKIRRNTIRIEETGCDGAVGMYKLIFFSNGDSLGFEPISDSCAIRRNGMSRTVLGRVK
jgi:hypothetical protein